MLDEKHPAIDLYIRQTQKIKLSRFKTAGIYNKRYRVIRTRLTTRAEHLEMGRNRSVDASIHTLR